VILVYRHRDFDLAWLRRAELIGFAAYAGYCGWKDYDHYSRYWERLQSYQQWPLLSHSCLNWAFLIISYGVLIPNDWRRSLRVVAIAAFIPLATYMVAWVISPASYRPASPVLDLLALARVMAIAVAISVFGAHRISSLGRAAYEARHLGQYQIKRRLGAGGMGEVYLAEHRLRNQLYAIKLIPPEVAANPTCRARFEREVRAMAHLTHWNTIEIIDYGHSPDGTFYYAMEYLPGLTLGELVERDGPLPPGRVVYLLRQACAALREAPAIGVIHRDIKPSNIMVTEQGGLADVVKVLDFGLVHDLGEVGRDEKLTRPGVWIGTPGYMAPEQAEGLADARTDVYGLGAVSYYLLTGRAPFAGPSTLEILAAQRAAAPPLRELRPAVPADLEAVIQLCLRLEAGNRFPNVDVLERALAGCACAAEWGPAQAADWWHVAPGRHDSGKIPAAAEIARRTEAQW
jgi:serine/threonine-protein kinase